jgi:hypothetical protein
VVEVEERVVQLQATVAAAELVELIILHLSYFLDHTQ